MTLEDSALAARAPDQPDQSFIAQFYDVDHSRTRTLGAKFWLASEHHPRLSLTVTNLSHSVLSLYQKLGIAFVRPLLQLASLLISIKQRVVCQPTLITNEQRENIIDPNTARSYLLTKP